MSFAKISKSMLFTIAQIYVNQFYLRNVEKETNLIGMSCDVLIKKLGSIGVKKITGL